MRFLVPFFLAVLSPALSQPAFAAPAAATPDAARLAAADRLLDAMGYDSLLDRTTAAMAAEAERTLPDRLEAAANEPIPDDLKAKLVSIITGFVKQTIDTHRANLRRGTALIYARHFTTAEIERMIELQRDPVLVKMQSELPQIMAESVALSQAAIQAQMPALMEQLKASIEDYQKSKESPGA